MNLYEKLNRLDDITCSFVFQEGLRRTKPSDQLLTVLKHLNLTLNQLVKKEQDEEFSNADTYTLVGTSNNIQAQENKLRNMNATLLSEEGDTSKYIRDYEVNDNGTYVCVKVNEQGRSYLVIVDRKTMIEKLCDDSIYDDDIDEMLNESTEQYELSTLVKDSINHLVNDLGKDPMADDFGDDICADLENNYDIDVPQNPVKYADWCDAVMSEVSRQLNNKEELTEGARNNKLQSIADKIIKYAEEHPESLRNFKYMYDYIDNLSQEGRFEIPAKVGQFVVEDPENVTEEEAEKFINMLLDETDVGDKLVEVKRAAQRSAKNELRNKFPSI